MIPRIIHHIWLGDPMPDRLREFIQSFRDHHNTWSHIIWDEAMLTQQGFLREGMSARLRNHASVSNLMRLLVLEQFGGVYVDADVDCLRSFAPLLAHRAFAAVQDQGRVCNAVLGAEPHHPWIVWQVAQAPSRWSGDAAWGVYLATDAPREGLAILPQEAFYPWLYNENPRAVDERSYAIHLWEGSWTR